MTWLTFFPGFFARIGADLVVTPGGHALRGCLALARLYVLQSTVVLLLLHAILSIGILLQSLYCSLTPHHHHQQQQQQDQQQGDRALPQPPPGETPVKRVFQPSEYVRTSEDRFHGVAELWPDHAGDYMEFAGLRVHYLDAWPTEATTTSSSSTPATLVLCHGQLSWSIQYRKVLPYLLGCGYRVVLLDFIGHGRSDKLLQGASMTPELHMEVLVALMDKLQLQGVTLGLQGCLGAACVCALLRVPQGMVQRLVLLGVPCLLAEVPLSWSGLRAAAAGGCWVSMAHLLGCYMPVTALVLLLATRRDMTLQEAAAYGAPYPSAQHKAVLTRPPGLGAVPGCSLLGALQQAAKAFGLSTAYCHLTAMQTTHRTYIAKEARLDRGMAETGRMWMPSNWRGPTLVLIGEQDPLSACAAGWFHGPLQADCLSYCPGPKVVRGAGHHLVEDAPRLVAQELHAFVCST